MTCLVCGRSSFTNTLIALERCSECGFITWRGEIDPTALYHQEYFAGEEYPDYVGQEDALRRSMRRHLTQMRRYTELRGALLEIGCAYGFFLTEAKRWFDLVVGVDVVHHGVEHARKNGLDAREGDLLSLDLGGQTFDAACMWDTIEHLERPDLYLERTRSLLNQRGTLFLTTGDIGSFNARLRGPKWRQIHPPTHLHYFSRDTIRRLLERTGFELLGIETAAYYHTLFNVLGSLRLRGGRAGQLAGRALDVVGPRRAGRLGFWIDLFDIMFVAARAR